MLLDSSTNCGVRGDDTQSVLLQLHSTGFQTMTAAPSMSERNADKSMHIVWGKKVAHFSIDDALHS
jgi:hypothetical protein